MACFGKLNFLVAYFVTLSVEDKGKGIFSSSFTPLDVLVDT
jgi:hypothetical protein